MMINTTRAAVFALAMTMPVAMHAQRGMGQGPGRAGGNPVAPLIDMRRELNLSSRQLAQLDSIERTLLQRNESLRGRLRARLDSVQPRRRPSSEEEIAAFRAEGDSMRALRRVIVRNDSVARAGAMAVLTDSQRVRVRERMAERRGFAAGRMSMMRGGQRGLRQEQMGRPGMRQGGMGGRMGMAGPGMRARGRMGGPDGFGPRWFDNRRPGTPGDTLAPMMRRFRGMNPPDSIAPGNQGVAPRPRLRRPPADSGR
jgi:hypothetical protein